MSRSPQQLASAPLPRQRGTARRARRITDLLTAGAAAYQEFEDRGDREAFDRSLATYERAFALTRPRVIHRVDAMVNLAAVLGRHARAPGDSARRDRALALLTAVLAEPTTERVRGFALAHLGELLLNRRRHDDVEDDLRRASEALAEAMMLAAGDPDDYARIANNLGIACSELHQRDGQLEDLDGALLAYQEAVNAVPDLDGHRQSNLATGLAERYATQGDPADLDYAIQLMRQVSDQPADQPEGSEVPDEAADRLENLALALRDRYLRDGNIEDVEESIAALRTVTNRTADAPDQASTLDQLALSLRLHALRVNDATELQRAVDLHRQAAELAVTDADRAQIQANRAGSLRALAKARVDATLAADAVAALREAASLTSSEPDRAAILTNLGNALLDWQAVEGSTATTEDIEEAVRVTGESVDLTPATSPSLAGRINNHALALARAYELTANGDDRDRALAGFRRSCALSVDGSAPDRLRTARNWCDLALAGQLWDEASDALSEIRAAADDVLASNLTRPHRAAWLAVFDGYAADAAVIAAHRHTPDRAVEWLEWSRVKLALAARGRDWGQLARLARSHRELADRYLRAVDRIRALESLEPG